jgi:serine/threonine protein kinase
MPIASGTQLGAYEIFAPLGAGGMGEVYRARDTRLERTVAIKILPSQVSKDPVRKQRFEREAKTISSLNHPHICTLHDIGSQEGVDYLVMECMEGETLAKRLEKGALPAEQVLKFGAQIADALDKAHRAGDCPSRSETWQHHAHADRCETSRLWPGQAYRATRERRELRRKIRE